MKTVPLIFGGEGAKPRITTIKGNFHKPTVADDRSNL